MKNNKISYSGTWLFLLRISIGWLFFYAGITKVLNSEWTSAGYLQNAKTFTGLYNLLAKPGVIGVVDFLNQWGLTLIGLALILGIAVKLNSRLGALLMILYYFPAAEFPSVSHGFIVDDHIIYALALIFLASIKSGHRYSLVKWCCKIPVYKKFCKVLDNCPSKPEKEANNQNPTKD